MVRPPVAAPFFSCESMPFIESETNLVVIQSYENKRRPADDLSYDFVDCFSITVKQNVFSFPSDIIINMHQTLFVWNNKQF